MESCLVISNFYLHDCMYYLSKVFLAFVDWRQNISSFNTVHFLIQYCTLFINTAKLCNTARKNRPCSTLNLQFNHYEICSYIYILVSFSGWNIWRRHGHIVFWDNFANMTNMWCDKCPPFKWMVRPSELRNSSWIITWSTTLINTKK